MKVLIADPTDQAAKDILTQAGLQVDVKHGPGPRRAEKNHRRLPGDDRPLRHQANH